MSKTTNSGVAEMKNLKQFEVWFVTGSQHLYGPDVLRQVDADSQQIAAFLDASESIPCTVVFKPVVKTAQEISGLCTQATAARIVSA